MLEYLPTLTPKVIYNNPNVGKYSSTMDPMGYIFQLGEPQVLAFFTKSTAWEISRVAECHFQTPAIPPIPR